MWWGIFFKKEGHLSLFFLKLTFFYFYCWKITGHMEVLQSTDNFFMFVSVFLFSKLPLLSQVTFSMSSRWNLTTIFFVHTSLNNEYFRGWPHTSPSLLTAWSCFISQLWPKRLKPKKVWKFLCLLGITWFNIFYLHLFVFASRTVNS